MPRTKRESRSALPTSIRLSETDKKLWEALAQHLGMSLAGVIVRAIRELAQSQGIKVEAEER